jgi:ligand-binding sensor domain-containing protein
MHQIQKMTASGSTVWCATNGGLLSFDASNRTFRSWTNTEGLASVQVSAVSCDSENRIYIGFLNGRIQRFDQASSSWLSLDDYAGHAIHCLLARNDTLFVGLDIGLSVYRLSKREVKETYKRLGATLPMEVAVKTVLLSGKEIWVGTDEGAARASLDNPNLLDPNAWTNWNAESGLPQKKVADLFVLNEILYAATERGVSAYRNGGWTPLSDGLPNAEIYNLAGYQNRLAAATSSGVYVFQENKWARHGSDLGACRALASVSTDLWVGTDNGIAAYSESQNQWMRYTPNSPAGNLFSDIAVDKNGVVWCASANANGTGFYRFDGEYWKNYSTHSDPPIIWDDVYSMTVDRSGAKWIGMWGRGILYWDEKSPFRYYNKQNGKLAGITQDQDFAVVSKSAVDSSGTVWIINFQAVDQRPLVSVTPDSVWTYYGLPTTECKRIVVDQVNRKWIGTETQGVLVYDDSGTPSTKSDDPAIGTLTTSDGLGSNQITDLAVDRDGLVWIGTPAGLFYYENGKVKQRYGLLSDNVTRLLVDGVNNLWVGTGSGLSCFLTREYRWQHFHAENSGLVDNGVTALAMDYSNGKLYAGTNRGLSVLETPFSEPLTEMADLRLYPNPFIPAEHANLVIDGLSFGVSVHIFGQDGYRVRRFSAGDVIGRKVFWDGRNERGEPVSGGIYVVVEQNEGGERRIGKAALIR